MLRKHVACGAYKTPKCYLPDLLQSFEINFHRPKCLQLWYTIPLPLERNKKGTLTLRADPIAPSIQVDNLTVVNTCFMKSDTIAQWDCEKENKHLANHQTSRDVNERCSNK